MANRDNILKELNELGSQLPTISSSTIYRVPDGYFDGLASQVLNRIKAMDADAEEIFPVAGDAWKITPYQAPEGYFEGLENRLMQAILANQREETPQQELQSLSPLLANLKKQNPYSIPENYFESLSSSIIKDTAPAPAKVVSMTSRKWFRYAAAAVVTGVLILSGFLFLGKNDINPDVKSYAWVKKNMKDVSTEALDSFITITEKETQIIASNTTTVTAGNEVKELVKNISDEELQSFLNDVEIAEPESDEDVILN